MLRLSTFCLTIHLVLAGTALSQEMLRDQNHFGLVGTVHNVVTTECTLSGKGDSRTFVSQTLEFDDAGRLIEETDVHRVIEEESFRSTYIYSSTGKLAERSDFKADGSPAGKTVFDYDANGKKAEEFVYAPRGWLQARFKFDDHDNQILAEYFSEDGSMQNTEVSRYEYSAHGNTLEQIYYPPPRDPSQGIRIVGRLALDALSKTTEIAAAGHRFVFVRDETGQLREKYRFLPDGSLMEKELFSEAGLLTEKLFVVGQFYSQTTLYDDQGRARESHLVAVKGFASLEAADIRTTYAYDELGNLNQNLRVGQDGVVISKSTNKYEYDAQSNWIVRTETSMRNSNNPHAPAKSSETVHEAHRALTYF